MTQAFLSYTMRDGVLNPSHLEEIAERLKSAHEFVYVDLLHNDSHLPQEHVEDALRRSSTLYLVETPAALSSHWVRRELSLAGRLGLDVIPVGGPLCTSPPGGAIQPLRGGKTHRDSSPGPRPDSSFASDQIPP